MGYYEFPHTRNYDTDLGYLIKQYLTLREKVETLIATQTINYADPLQWDITKQYAKNYIVVNGYNAYLSKQPVPAGILITNTDYWLVVGDFIKEFDGLRENIANANNGVSPTLLVSRKKGDLIWWNDILYICLKDIEVGTALVIGTNVKEITIENYITSYVDSTTKVFSSVDEMIADTTLVNGQTVRTTGYHKPNDLGGCYYIVTDTIPTLPYETLDNGLYAALQIHNGLTLQMFGAYGDNEHDDTEAIRKALRYASHSLTKLTINVIGPFKITEKIIIDGDGQFILTGTNINRSSFNFVGANACLEYHDATQHMYEIEIRDLSLNGDYTQINSLITFNDCWNIYLSRLYTNNAGRNTYAITFKDSGITTIEKCIISGSLDIAEHPAYSNGIYCDPQDTILTIRECNVWNLDNFINLNGSVLETNIEDNWIECINSLIIKNISSGTDGRNSLFNISNNHISIHPERGFIPTSINFVTVNADSNTTWDGTTINIERNLIYLYGDNISLKGNSLVYIPKYNQGGVFNINFNENVLSGKKLFELNAYVFYNANQNVYLSPVIITASNVTSRLDVSRLSDNKTIISSAVRSNNPRGGLAAINGIYLSDSEIVNDGRLYYENGAYFVTINGGTKRLMDINTKIIKVKSLTAVSGSDGNISVGTPSSIEHIISAIPNVDGYAIPFIANSNNFIKVVNGSGTPIASTSVTLTIYYVEL